MSTPVDGRVSRRERNRAAVVDSMVSLIEEGVLDVTMERAAERAGVSVRSVFRYFDNVEDLRRQTVNRHFQHVDQQLRVCDPTVTSRHQRITILVEDRLALFEMHAGPARLARQRAEFLPIVAAHLDRVRQRLISHLETQLAPELATLSPAEAANLVALLDVVVSLDALEALQQIHGRDRDTIRALWIAAVDELVPTVATENTNPGPPGEDAG